MALEELEQQIKEREEREDLLDKLRARENQNRLEEAVRKIAPDFPPVVLSDMRSTPAAPAPGSEAEVMAGVMTALENRPPGPLTALEAVLLMALQWYLTDRARLCASYDRTLELRQNALNRRVQ